MPDPSQTPPGVPYAPAPQSSSAAQAWSAPASSSQTWTPPAGVRPHRHAAADIPMGAGLPAGMMQAWAGSAAAPLPVGWLLCNGQAVNRAQFGSLFAALGTTHGAGDGSTTFNLPDMRGRTPFGQDTSQAQFANIGQAGGSSAIAVGDLPSHQHGLANHTHTLGGHTHGLNNHSHGGSTGFTEPPLHHHGSGSGSGFIVEIGSTVGLVGNPSIQASGPQANTDNNSSINHNHPIGGDTSNTTGPSNGSDGPAPNLSDPAGGSSATGKLPPYIVMRWLIKT